MNTPLWEAAGTFRAVCNSLRRGQTHPDVPAASRELASAVAVFMREAHIVTCPREQVEALPSLGDEVDNFAHHLRLPFPITYLSLEGASTIVGSLAGVLMAEVEPGWMAFPFSSSAMARGFPALHAVSTTGSGLMQVSLDPGRNDWPGGEEIARDVVTFVERAIAVLALLDNTIGVELREKDRREVSRQTMRRAERDCARIAWTVAINVPKRSAPSRASENKANYSHRFERAANFACFTKGPHVADPSKLASWCPRHGPHACRREYRPATIVGPAHLPLIPKVRRVMGTVGG